jgi:hypothetical protein
MAYGLGEGKPNILKILRGMRGHAAGGNMRHAT